MREPNPSLEISFENLLWNWIDKGLIWNLSNGGYWNMYKGIDDALAAGAKPIVLSSDAAKKEINQIANLGNVQYKNEIVGKARLC